jgi:hypothetical protein
MSSEGIDILLNHGLKARLSVQVEERLQRQNMTKRLSQDFRNEKEREIEGRISHLVERLTAASNRLLFREFCGQYL